MSEVAAFLRMEPAEVRALIDLDGLPAKRVPGAKRAVLRVFLPDFWRWFCDRPGETGMELASYARFETEFEAAQGRGGDA